MFVKLILTKHWATFWAIFSQTRLVTLFEREKTIPEFFSAERFQRICSPSSSTANRQSHLSRRIFKHWQK
jgi:hypothetical protein